MDRIQHLLAGVRLPDVTPTSIGVLVGMAVLLFALLIARSLRAQTLLSRRVSPAKHRALDDFLGGRPLGADSQARAEHVFLRASRLVVPTERAALVEIRKSLINAAYFSPLAIPIYFAVRIGSALGLPILGLFVSGLIPDLSGSASLLMASGLSAMGLVGPPVYLDWRRSKMREKYRQTFPDFMDVLVVCVEAGQSLQGAIDRVAREMARTNPEFGANLHIVSLELRAGSDLHTALGGFAERLGIEEVQSLTLLLKQSAELGTSLAGSLRVYSDEMRDKRLMRAEAKANALPVKMVVPLGLFIFPVILVVIMLPLAIRITGALV